MSLLVLAFANAAQAGSVALTWDATANAAGYKLSYGVSSNSYTTTIDVGNVLAVTVPNLPAGSTFYFAVKAYDAARTKESVYSNEVSATLPDPVTPPAATVDFSPVSTAINAGQAVSFSPVVTGTITDWKWDFGDGSSTQGTTATIPTAMHAFGNAGTFTVSLSANNGAIGKTGTVTVAPVAAFSASALSGVAPFSVSFTDSSTGSPANWSWNFGDSTTGTTQNPAHTFSVPGTYTVSLSVTAGGVTSGNTATQTINVLAPATTGGGTGGGSGGQPPAGSGLVLAYSFDEGAGTQVADASGSGNTGTIKSARWTTSGKFGKALNFDGRRAMVVVPDSASLRLSMGMTLAAWVRPANVTTNWRDLIVKGDDEYALFASSSNGVPAAGLRAGGAGAKSVIFDTSALPANVWSHVAATYDGSNLRLYRNGVQVSVTAVGGGPMQTGTGALQIGGDALYGRFFKGGLDELRVYNRALSDAEIGQDMSVSVATANAPATLLGEKIASSTFTAQPGVAYAIPVTAAKSGVITGASVLIGDGAASAKLLAAIYSDRKGLPRKRLARAAIRPAQPGEWSSVALQATAIRAGARYWIAILSRNEGVELGSTADADAVVEMSPAGKALRQLPLFWSAGGRAIAAQKPAIFGVGY